MSKLIKYERALVTIVAMQNRPLPTEDVDGVVSYAHPSDVASDALCGDTALVVDQIVRSLQQRYTAERDRAADESDALNKQLAEAWAAATEASAALEAERAMVADLNLTIKSIQSDNIQLCSAYTAERERSADLVELLGRAVRAFDIVMAGGDPDDEVEPNAWIADVKRALAAHGGTNENNE